MDLPTAALEMDSNSVSGSNSPTRCQPGPAGSAGQRDHSGQGAWVVFGCPIKPHGQRGSYSTSQKGEGAPSGGPNSSGLLGEVMKFRDSLPHLRKDFLFIYFFANSML